MVLLSSLNNIRSLLLILDSLGPKSKNTNKNDSFCWHAVEYLIDMVEGFRQSRRHWFQWSAEEWPDPDNICIAWYREWAMTPRYIAFWAVFTLSYDTSVQHTTTTNTDQQQIDCCRSCRRERERDLKKEKKRKRKHKLTGWRLSWRFFRSRSFTRLWHVAFPGCVLQSQMWIESLHIQAVKKW